MILMVYYPPKDSLDDDLGECLGYGLGDSNATVTFSGHT